MTTFGKILTIFVLLGSLAVGGLCVFIYIQHVKARADLVKYDKAYKESEASERAYKAKVEQLEKSNSTLNDQLNRKVQIKRPGDEQNIQVKMDDALKLKNEEILTLKSIVSDLEKKYILEAKKTGESNATIQAHQLESEQNTKDKKKLQELLDKEVKDNIVLLAAANTAREKQVEAEINLIATKERNKQLEDRTQELVKELALLKKGPQTGTTGVTTVSLSAPNPPTFAVDGKILEVREGLVEISIGSDAGLVKGHTLDVFHLAGKPQYLGMIRLITVEPTRSVGQVIGKPVAPIQKFDNVASKILN